MSPERTVELKLQAYHAAITACSAGKSYSAVNMGGDRGPTTGEIKAEAERLWKWMTETDGPSIPKLPAMPPTTMGKAVRLVDDAAIKEAVNRFLTWRLPKTFGPDCGISFQPLQGHQWPVGTNLLTYTEAEEMLRHVLQLPKA